MEIEIEIGSGSILLVLPHIFLEYAQSWVTVEEGHGRIIYTMGAAKTSITGIPRFFYLFI